MCGRFGKGAQCVVGGQLEIWHVWIEAWCVCVCAVCVRVCTIKHFIFEKNVFKSVFLVIQQLNCTDLKKKWKKQECFLASLMYFVNILSFILFFIIF